jgi:phenylacetate-coenzyme A ligase PaaK-like adenylate-forming protein
MLRFAFQGLALARVPKHSPKRVAITQRRRLDRLVRHATTHSPFYQNKYKHIDIGNFQLEDLPPTNKMELMANFDAALTDRAVTRADLEKFVDNPKNEGSRYLGRYAPSHTSGSQGQPMLMVQPQSAIDLLFALQMTRGNVARATPVEALRRFFNPARLAIVTLKRGFYPSASAFEYMPAAAAWFMKTLWLSQTDPDVIEKLNRFRPTALTAYAGVLELLALEAQAGALRLSPELRQITNNSEVLTARAQDRIETAFGLHVLNNYATGECPFLTYGCPTNQGAHINADWAILEVVDDDYQPVPAGTPGRRVLITNLANTLQPFIRYEIGDVLTMANSPCDCGSNLPRVEHIEGRTADTFWIHDGQRFRTVIGSVFKNAFDYTREVREWQAVQTDRNQVTLRLEPLPGQSVDLERAQLALDRQLEMYGFKGLLHPSFEIVPSLPPDPNSGKFRRMISLVGPPTEISRTLRRDPAQPKPHSPHFNPTPNAKRTRPADPNTRDDVAA